MKEKKHILIVNSNEQESERLKNLIDGIGYKVVVCTNSEEAVIHYSSQFFDVVVSDFDISGKAGTQLLKELKEINEYTVLIFLANEDNLKNMRCAVKEGATDLILRPFDDNEFLKSIEDVIEKRKKSEGRKKYHQELERYIDETTETLKLQKEALEREQERSRGIIREAHFGIVFLDGESEEVYMLNKRGKKLFRLKEEYENTYLSKNFKEIFPEKVVERIDDVVRQVRSEKGVIDIGDFVEENGILNFVGYPVMIGDMVSSIVIITDDVTEKKIMERQLLQSSRLAGIGELAAGVAHEINNPVAFVMSNTRMLEKYFSRIRKLLKKYERIENDVSLLEDAEKRNKMIDEIIKLKEDLHIEKALKNIDEIVNENIDGLERVKKIVFDLKNFSHTDKEVMEEADVNKIMEDTLNLVWNELKYKAEVVRDLNDIPKIQCFPQQISQVFANILVNGVHAIEGKGTITINTYSQKGLVKIKISDTGCGMNKDTMVKIFNPFFTTKEADKGTGLGLSIAFKIIEKHNGSISVESDPGKGTTFIVALPVIQEKKPSLKTIESSLDGITF